MKTQSTFQKRRNTILAMLCTGTMLIGCKQATTVPDDFTRVTQLEIDNYIGKKIQLNDNFIMLSDDGTFTGQWNEGPIAGDWEMKEDYWCRVLTEFYQPERLNQEDCQIWEANGSMLRGTRDKGTGKSFVYTVK